MRILRFPQSGRYLDLNSCASGHEKWDLQEAFRLRTSRNHSNLSFQSKPPTLRPALCIPLSSSENAFLQVLKIHESFGKITRSFSHFIKPVAEVAERPWIPEFQAGEGSCLGSRCGAQPRPRARQNRLLPGNYRMSGWYVKILHYGKSTVFCQQFKL